MLLFSIQSCAFVKREIKREAEKRMTFYNCYSGWWTFHNVNCKCIKSTQCSLVHAKIITGKFLRSKRNQTRAVIGKRVTSRGEALFLMREIEWSVCVPLEGDVACVKVRGDDGRGEPLCCVLLWRQHGSKERWCVTWRQSQRLRVHHLLLVVHLHHHGPTVWIIHSHTHTHTSYHMYFHFPGPSLIKNNNNNNNWRIPVNIRIMLPRFICISGLHIYFNSYSQKRTTESFNI